MQIGAGDGFDIFRAIMERALNTSAGVTHDNLDPFRSAQPFLVGALEPVTAGIVTGLVVVVTVDIGL